MPEHIKNTIPDLLKTDLEIYILGLDRDNLKDSNFSAQNSLEPNFDAIDFIREKTQLLIVEYWNKINDGLTLTDIENILAVILLIRFLILIIRYNLKTSFYITSIGLVAGYLWYRHLIDLISIYRNILGDIPFLNNLGVDAFNARQYNYQIASSNQVLGENVRWYNLGALVYYSCLKGIISIDSETGIKYYIDPLSMIISNLDESAKTIIVPIYYKVYNDIFPRVFKTVSRFWNQLSGIATYALVTRIGKKYCPYLVRWHWTLIIVFSIIEPVIQFFIWRAKFFEECVLLPKIILASSKEFDDQIFDALEIVETYGIKNIPEPTPDPELYNSLLSQMFLLKGVIGSVIFIHLGLVLLALLHALCGQYFYLPFFTDNAELHIGPRLKSSIYSGGYTAWQDADEKRRNFYRVFPKFWFGWFGRGTTKPNFVKFVIKKVMLRFKKLFK